MQIPNSNPGGAPRQPSPLRSGVAVPGNYALSLFKDSVKASATAFLREIQTMPDASNIDVKNSIDKHYDNCIAAIRQGSSSNLYVYKVSFLKEFLEVIGIENTQYFARRLDYDSFQNIKNLTLEIADRYLELKDSPIDVRSLEPYRPHNLIELTPNQKKRLKGEAELEAYRLRRAIDDPQDMTVERMKAWIDRSYSACKENNLQSYIENSYEFNQVVITAFCEKLGIDPGKMLFMMNNPHQDISLEIAQEYLPPSVTTAVNVSLPPAITADALSSRFIGPDGERIAYAIPTPLPPEPSENRNP